MMSQVTWPVRVTQMGTSLLTTVPDCCFRGPSPPSAGVTETPACSWRAARRCMWCAWSTGWPACSSCVSRASPVLCVRRRTWASSTCPRYSAPTSPVLSYPPSRCTDDCVKELPLQQLDCTGGKRGSAKKKCWHVFSRRWKNFTALSSLCPSPQSLTPTTSGTLSAIPQLGTRGSTAPWRGQKIALRQEGPATHSTWNI